MSTSTLVYDKSALLDEKIGNEQYGTIESQ